VLSQSTIIVFVSAQGEGNAVLDSLSSLIGQEIERAGQVGEVLLQIGQSIAAFAVEDKYPVRECGQAANIII